MEDIECGGFIFISNFDSGNLGKIELVSKKDTVAAHNVGPSKSCINNDEPDIEFNIWTKPDCAGTEFENGNRTWFYFGIRGGFPCAIVKLNLVDLNKQAKMYSQGMAPVCKTVPGKPHWERVRDKPTYTVTDNIFTLSFRYCCPENPKTTTYFAFTYPYTYQELQSFLSSVDDRFSTQKPAQIQHDDIYYARECVCNSLDNRRIDLITISSYHNITSEREPRLRNLFTDETVPRPYRFKDKKVIFVSARVHPGETPASFVFNGLINLLLVREDPIAMALRRLYVFKMIPFLNPDGVARGHYRTDSRGINLNRVYLNPTFIYHPSVYAARNLVRFYHYGYEKEDDNKFDLSINLSLSSSSGTVSNRSETCISPNIINNSRLMDKVSVLSLDEDTLSYTEMVCVKCKSRIKKLENVSGPNINRQFTPSDVLCQNCFNVLMDKCSPGKIDCDKVVNNPEDVKGEPVESGIFLYMDLHGHASKKGIFMYGNHFDDVEKKIECMLLPKLMAMNNFNFHFSACNFTERNMYLRDKRDGSSREGCGRVAVYKLTGLVRSYTLECNYNTGRMVNVLPPTLKETGNKPLHSVLVPPKYTPSVFEEVGRALAASFLDLTGENPNTRLVNSEFRTTTGLREWMRLFCSGQRPVALPVVTRGHFQMSRGSRRILSRLRNAGLNKSTKKLVDAPTSISSDRKENFSVNKPIFSNLSQPSCSQPVFTAAPINKSNGRTKFTSATISSTLKSKEILTKIKRLSATDVKGKRDTSLRLKGGSECLKSKSCTSHTVDYESSINEQKDALLPKEGAKRFKMSPIKKYSPPSPENRIKLRELCFVKTEHGKKIVAKYDDPTGSNTSSENLIISWGPNCNAEVLPIAQQTSSKIKQGISPKFNVKPKLHATQKNLVRSTSVSSVLKRKKVKPVLRRLSAPVDGGFKMMNRVKKRKKKSKFV